LFSICKTETECSYEPDDDLWMIDLETYMGLTSYKPTLDANYCEACEQSYDWCT
jgi:hypothetical protein